MIVTVTAVNTVPVVNYFCIQKVGNNTWHLFITAVCGAEGIPYALKTAVSTLLHYGHVIWKQTAFSTYFVRDA